jgi:predicted small integral membrane protein
MRTSIMSIRLRAFSRLVLVMGLAIWLTIAVFNNLTDPQTNRLLLGQTLSMELLKPESVLGSGLTWRALPTEWSHSLLYLVVGVQAVIAVLLLRAAASYGRAALNNSSETLAQGQSRAILALTCFLMLWMWFFCGGLWFGYWLKQGAIQSVHMTLILTTLASLVYVQMDDAKLASSH